MLRAWLGGRVGRRNVIARKSKPRGSEEQQRQRTGKDLMSGVDSKNGASAGQALSGLARGGGGADKGGR